MKTLFWKEWMENRPIIAASVALMAVLFASLLSIALYQEKAGDNAITPQSIFEPLVLLFWCIPAVLSSTTMIAPEVASGTLRFLSSVPVSKSGLWWIKFISATVIYLLSIVASAVAFAALYAAVATIGVVHGASNFDYGQSTTIGLLFTVPLFAVGSLASALSNRIVNALLLTVVLASVFGIGIAFLASAQGLLIPGEDVAIGCAAVVTIVCASFSNRIFVKGGMFKSGNWLSFLHNYWVVDFIALVVALTISYFWLMAN